MSWGSSYPSPYPTAQELRGSVWCHDPLSVTMGQPRGGGFAGPRPGHAVALDTLPCPPGSEETVLPALPPSGLTSSGERGAGCGRGERLADSLASCTHFTLKTKEEGSGIFIVHPFQERAAQL